MTDWINRSQAPGVVWAHRFDDPAVVEKFRLWNDNPQAVEHVRHQPGDGILGDGCLEILTPAGVAQSGSWGRPLQPIAGYDINRAGLETRPDFGNDMKSIWTSTSASKYFGHASYHAGLPGVFAGDQFIGTDYYIQYRVKFSRSRFASGEPSGKLLMLVTAYRTPSQELVTTVRTSYGGRWYHMYTSVGTSWNSELNDPQRGGAGSSLQPGGAYDNTCIQGTAPDGTDKCWLWPTDEWVTVLLHVIPGRDGARPLDNPDNPRDTGIEVWVAKAGETRYTKIWEKLDYQWEYGVTFINGSEQPYGWNWLNFTAFTGGSVAVPSINGYYHRHDQVIFSTQFIECPQV